MFIWRVSDEARVGMRRELTFSGKGTMRSGGVRNGSFSYEAVRESPGM